MLACASISTHCRGGHREHESHIGEQASLYCHPYSTPRLAGRIICLVLCEPTGRIRAALPVMSHLFPHVTPLPPALQVVGYMPGHAVCSGQHAYVALSHLPQFTIHNYKSSFINHKLSIINLSITNHNLSITNHKSDTYNPRLTHTNTLYTMQLSYIF